MKDLQADNIGELWDIYDINKQRTGRNHLRGQRLANGDYHLVANAIIFNDEKQILIQQRSFKKLSRPGQWTAESGGSVLQNETSQHAIGRELREELNLVVDIAQLGMLTTRYYFDWIEDWYAVHVNVKLDDLTIQQSEVERIRWATLEEVLTIASSNGIDEAVLYKQAYDLLF